MKKTIVFIFVFTFFSCGKTKETEKEIIRIDPRTFTETEILLSEIADDISYVTMDNKFPIGIIYFYKIVNDYIYMAIKDIGVARFTKEGEFDSQYGKIGRGPGEYIYFLKFAVDNTNGTVYVMDRKMDDIEVYNGNGTHIRNIKLPVDNEGFGLRDIEFFNSSIVLAQYINMGRGEYNWLIVDTLGNIQRIKKNPYPVFKGRWGGNGGIYKYNDYIGYWDSYKDTIFKISTNFDYEVIGLFSAGEHRYPRNSAAYNPIDVYQKNKIKFCKSHLFFETNGFFVYKYFLYGLHLAVISKSTGLKKTIGLGVNKKGIINDIDNGIDFMPENYFTKGNREYIISKIYPFALKAHVASNSFRKSIPKYPEKKKELEKLANSLDENDNPVLMLVKLKKQVGR